MGRVVSPKSTSDLRQDPRSVTPIIDGDAKKSIYKAKREARGGVLDDLTMHVPLAIADCR